MKIARHLNGINIIIGQSINAKRSSIRVKVSGLSTLKNLHSSSLRGVFPVSVECLAGLSALQ